MATTASKNLINDVFVLNTGDIIDGTLGVTGTVTLTTGDITSIVADGATAVAITLTSPAYTTSGAKLLSLENNATEKLSVDKDGNVTTSATVPTSEAHLSRKDYVDEQAFLMALIFGS